MFKSCIPTPMPKHGDAAFADAAGEQPVERLAAFGRAANDGRVEHPAVAAGVEVGAADQDHAVERAEHLVDVFDLFQRRQDHRKGARLQQGVVVAARDVGDGRLVAVGVSVIRVEANDRLRHLACTPCCDGLGSRLTKANRGVLRATKRNPFTQRRPIKASGPAPTGTSRRRTRKPRRGVPTACEPARHVSSLTRRSASVARDPPRRVRAADAAASNIARSLESRPVVW